MSTGGQNCQELVFKLRAAFVAKWGYIKLKIVKNYQNYKALLFSFILDIGF